MQPTIAMKFAEYVAQVLSKYCRFGKIIYFNSRGVKFFTGITFYWCTLYFVYDVYKKCCFLRWHQYCMCIGAVKQYFR